MAEVFIFGQLLGCEGFPRSNVYCKWNFVTGSLWEALQGETMGQTHCDSPSASNESSVWNHPVDVHYVSRGLQGWPKIAVQVWYQDEFGRNDFCGYGVCNIPMSPGTFDLECVTWRPQGSASDEISSFFLGGAPQLRNEELVHSGEDRFRLRTVGTGVVKMQLNVMLRNFAKFGVKFS